MEAEGKSDAEARDRLMMSEAACLFERGICCYILPEVYHSQNKFKASIPQLQEYLGVDDSKEAELPRELKRLDPQRVLSEARKKWKHLQNFVYIPKAMQAIGFLKRDRIPVAHPSPIFLREVEAKIEQMETSYDEYSFPIIKEFIISMRKVLEENLELKHKDMILQ